MSFITSLLPAIEHFHTIGYWIAFFAALLETTIGFGFFIPGSTVILFMGALAAKGYFDLGDLIWFAVIGAVIGDNINYFLGKKFGSKIVSKGFLFIKPAHIKKGEEFFKRFDSKSIFFGRFIPSVKEVIPLVAGVFGMKRIPFIFWNVLGAIGWSLVWILPGYLFAHSLNLAQAWLTRTGLILTLLVVVIIIFYILKVFLTKKGKELFLFLSSISKSIKQAIGENKEVENFVNRHKKFFQFIKKRLDKNSFSGLPLTLLSVAMFYALMMFGGIIQDIINSDIIVGVDVRVANLMAIFRNSTLTNFFVWITLLGKLQVVLIFSLVIIFLMWLWKKQQYIISFLISIVGSSVFTYLGKFMFQRQRPGSAVYLEESFSFPSGHATIAVAFYGYLIYFLIRNIKKWKYKINIFLAGIFVILLIGFSRLYLGFHYVSDIWGGYLVGTIWLIISISLSEYLILKKSREIGVISLHRKGIYFATAGILLISICAYALFAYNYKLPSTIQYEKDKIIVSDIMDAFDSDQTKYSETLLGNKKEPLSFIFVVKSDKEFINLFNQAQWNLADDLSFKNFYKIAKAVIWKEAYPQAPITPDFWNSEIYAYGFEKGTELNNARVRHHARFWKTNYVTENGSNIFVGKASFDSGIKWGITHKIDPDVDTEREFLLKDLVSSGLITDIQKIQFVNPVLGSNFSGDPFFTDGQLYILSLSMQ